MMKACNVVVSVKQSVCVCVCVCVSAMEVHDAIAWSSAAMQMQRYFNTTVSAGVDKNRIYFEMPTLSKLFYYCNRKCVKLLLLPMTVGCMTVATL